MTTTSEAALTNVVSIIDYKLCNLDSIARAIDQSGGRARITDRPDDLTQADRIVLPGVGNFAVAIRNLRERGLDGALLEASGHGIPVLGICLGMQLLGIHGTEGEDSAGLGLIPADVVRLEPAAGERVPHIGWNSVEPVGVTPLFRGIAPGTDFYFVHSYHMRCNAEYTLARTPYCGGFVAAAGVRNVMAVQFHPEKSQKPGFQLLRNFLAL